MVDNRIYPVPDELGSRAWVNSTTYESMYAASVEDPEAFWAEHARKLDWLTPFSESKTPLSPLTICTSAGSQTASINVAANCLDRHLAERADQVAIIWEGDEPDDDEQITYRELHERVGRFGNALRSLGVRKGDRVTIYMPMIPEAAIAMLACARIGAIHSVVFGGFSPEALRGRIEDCESNVVITADEGVRGGKTIPLKANVDAAIDDLTSEHVDSVVVVKRTGGDIGWTDGRDHWYHEITAAADTDCPAEP